MIRVVRMGTPRARGEGSLLGELLRERGGTVFPTFR